MRFIPGPDLPTGGKIIGLDGIREAYETGRGSFRMRASTRIESVTPRRKGIVVTELPYNVGPERVIERIRGAGPGQEAQRDRRRHGPHRLRQGAAPGHRDQERVPPGGDPGAALPPDAARGVVLDQRGGAGRRPAPHPEPAPDARRLPRPPLRRRTTPLGASPPEGRRAPAPRRGAARRHPGHRRGHPADPLQRQHRAGQAAADDRVRPRRGADDLHPRHAAAQAHQVLAARARESAGGSPALHRRADRDPGRPGAAAQADR